ncbi:MAG: hypothetical protein M3Y59_16165 [Myxococcota bacterium]|nr:hypothetical protein [Myxococcota bacterium]
MPRKTLDLVESRPDLDALAWRGRATGQCPTVGIGGQPADLGLVGEQLDSPVGFTILEPAAQSSQPQLT